MSEQLSKEQQREAVKASFRQRDEDIEIIPATIVDRELLKETQEEVRVALYSRVSTDSLEQASSIALQEVSFDDIQRFHPNWRLVETYTDEGISGTSINHRQGFQRMIQDAEAAKFDLIVTRSVSRFARNLMDCVKTYRHLAKLPHPVYVFFVTNNLITNGKGEQSEMILNFMAMIAQEESHIKSDVMNGSIEQRFNAGKFLLSACLGYDRFRDSPFERPYLVINEKEAATIRYMYGLLLAGHNPCRIAEILNEEGHVSKKGNCNWSGASVVSILRNEKYYGAICARKTFTIDYLEHKKCPNRGEKNRYKKENHHPAIISKEAWLFAQKILDARTRSRGGNVFVLSVVQEGILRGFITINRNYYSAEIDDYIEANRSTEPVRERAKQVQLGRVSNYDFRGYESVSALLFSSNDNPTITFDYNSIKTNKVALSRMQFAEYVEVLFNPKTFEFAIRKASAVTPAAIRWSVKTTNGYTVCKTRLGAFTAMLYDYMGWNSSYKYKVYGQCREHHGDRILFFSLRDIELLVPVETDATIRRYTSYFPRTFLDQYGDDVYQSIYQSRAYWLDYFKVWDASIGSVAAKEDEIERQMRAESNKLLGIKEEDE